MVSQSAFAGRQLSVEAAPAHLQLTLPWLARDEHFVHLFTFTVDIGGDAAGCIQDARLCHERFVGPECRRLRLGVLAVLNALPLDYPRLKIACLRHSRANGVSENGVLKAPTAKATNDLLVGETRTATAVAEMLSRSSRAACAQRACLWVGDRVKRLGNTDALTFKAVTATVQNSSAAVWSEMVRAAAGVARERLQKLVGDTVDLPPLPVDAPEQKPAVAAAKASTLAPKVITRSGGVAVS